MRSLQYVVCDRTHFAPKCRVSWSTRRKNRVLGFGLELEWELVLGLGLELLGISVQVRVRYLNAESVTPNRRAFCGCCALTHTVVFK